MIAIVAVFFFSYVYHCTWATSEAYSSPSIVLSAHGGDGSTIIFDDFREAYYWLRKNTHPVSGYLYRNFHKKNIEFAVAEPNKFILGPFTVWELFRNQKSCRGGIMDIR